MVRISLLRYLRSLSAIIHRQRKWNRSTRRVPIFRQMTSYECGPACLAMVLTYFGRATSVSECRVACGVGRDGVTGLRLVEVARQYGLDVTSQSIDPLNLGSISLPVILHWRPFHFVVLEAWSPEAAIIVDPAKGRRSVTIEEFNLCFTGVVFRFCPGSLFEVKKSEWGQFWIGFCRTLLIKSDIRKAIVEIVVSSLLLQLLALVFPILTKVLFDSIQLQGNHTEIGKLAIVFGVLVINQAVISLLRAVLLVRLRRRLDKATMDAFMVQVFSLPFSFIQQRSHGDMLLRLQSNVVIREALTTHLLGVMFDAAFLSVYLTILWVMSREMTGIVLLMVCLQLFVVVGMRPRLMQLVEQELSSKAAETAYASESMYAIAIVKALGAEQHVINKWRQHFDDYNVIASNRGGYAACNDTIVSAIRRCSPFITLWVGASLMAMNQLSIGSMLALNTLASYVLSPIGTIITAGQQLAVIAANLERLGDVMQEKREENGGDITRQLKGTLEARNLSFKYSSDGSHILKNISFKIDQGQTLVIVGKTGSGKTTLLFLLLGLYQPSEGEVIYDGVNIKNLNKINVRNQCGVVLQDSNILQGSVMENIQFGREAVTEEDIIQAAEDAQLHQVVSRMPMGYSTLIGSGSGMLSGGERQRIGIARAFARRAVMLFMDEATNQLDVDTEAKVWSAVQRMNCTKIVISHRLSVARQADVVIVLDGGEVVEMGTPAELMQRRREYYRLSNIWKDENKQA